METMSSIALGGKTSKGTSLTIAKEQAAFKEYAATLRAIGGIVSEEKAKAVRTAWVNYMAALDPDKGKRTKKFFTDMHLSF